MADAKGCLERACTTLDFKAPSFTPLARQRYVVTSLGEVVCGPVLDSPCITLDFKAASFTPLARHRYVVALLGEVVCEPI